MTVTNKAFKTLAGVLFIWVLLANSIASAWYHTHEGYSHDHGYWVDQGSWVDNGYWHTHWYYVSDGY